MARHEDTDAMRLIDRTSHASFNQAGTGPIDRWCFRPAAGLKNPHLMTLIPYYWPRPVLLGGLPVQTRLFRVSSEAQLLGFCHWQEKPRVCPTLILIHGLEGSTESHYMRGIAAKAWKGGLNVVRLNQRTCGGSEHLSPGLYHGGMGGDMRSVVSTLVRDEGLESIWIAGYSMGGNITLNLAGEANRTPAALRGVVAVSPNIDPASCVTALDSWPNWTYRQHFVRSLKARVRRKERLFPGTFPVSRLRGIKTLREFDEIVTAPAGGFSGADEYYDRTGARRVLSTIEIPTLIITARDDPIVPYAQFLHSEAHLNPWITLVAPAHGGHCGFFQRARPEEDRYWGENRLVEFIVRQAWKRNSGGSDGYT